MGGLRLNSAAPALSLLRNASRESPRGAPASIRITKISLAELAVMDRLERAGNGVDKLKKLANPSCLFNRVFLSARPPTTQNCFLSISEIVRPVPSNMTGVLRAPPFQGRQSWSGVPVLHAKVSRVRAAGVQRTVLRHRSHERMSDPAHLHSRHFRAGVASISPDGRASPDRSAGPARSLLRNAPRESPRVPRPRFKSLKSRWQSSPSWTVSNGPGTASTS
jgi:hypothetical protein